MRNRILLFLLALLSVGGTAFAGVIKGVVKDAGNGGPLTGVIVSLKNTTKGAQTDIDGNYEIRDIADGSYDIVFSYTSFQTITQQVTIKGNNSVVFDISMKPENTELKDVTIKANKITNTENAVMMEIKSAHTIVSGISAKQIAKTMDRNAADVVKRVPGVTIQDDRFIVVRGLSDRYNTVWLNDASAPSAEVDKKSFSFDIIPSGLIDRMLVYKTPSADLPGDFAGGMVKIYTTSLKDQSEITVGVQTSYRQNSTGTNFNYNKASSTDWRGYDDGSRSIPNGTPAVISTSDPNISAITKAFKNDWIIYNKTTPVDYRINFSLSNVIKLKKVKIGNTFGLTYSNVNTNYNIHKMDWDSSAANVNYNDLKSENKVSVSAMDNLAVSVGNSKIEFKNLYSQIGKSTLIIRNTILDTSLIKDPSIDRYYMMGYESIATYTSQLTGTHKSKNESRKYNWCLGYTDVFRNQPDLRRIRYSLQSDSVYRAPVPSGSPDIVNGGGRFYASLYEHIYSFNHQFSQKMNIKDRYSFEVNLGNYVEFKHRSYNARELGYFIKSNSPNGQNAFNLKGLPIDAIFADSNLGDPKKNFVLNEGTNAYDRYSAENKLIASYIMINAPIGKKIKVSGGLRYEYNMQSMLGYISVDTLSPKITTKYLLPSVNVSYDITEKSLVRFAYGKTLNRPEFREFAPSYFYDFEENKGTYGSLYFSGLHPNGDTLKVAEIQNYDARWEWYPSPGEMIHAGVFYKKFRQPIQRAIIAEGAGDNKNLSFINTNDAYVAGMEFEVRKNLSFADNWIKTNFFKDFTVVGNLTISKSEMKITDTILLKRNYIETSTLQGQSPYIVNVGVYYENPDNGFQGSLLYNVFGPRLYAYGTRITGLESIGEMPFKSLDFAIAKSLYKHYSINVGIQNLLDSKVLFVQDIDKNNKFDAGKDKEVKSYKPGRYFSIGVKFKF